MTSTEHPVETTDKRAWYAGVSGYQWLVLVIACAGWIFDIYENQIFALTRGGMLSDLLHTTANSAEVKKYGDTINSVFLLGGAMGGIGFGMLADRFGRGFAMTLSILVYATFTALTAAAQTVTQVAVLRFFVAAGTGGEWAVAAALVSEVFPKHARAHASGIFHASSILGVLAAGLTSIYTGSNWRLAYLVGLAPALLVFAVRFYIRNPRPGQTPQEAQSIERASFAEFWRDRTLRKRAILGLLLAAIGLTGYWGVYVAGQDLARDFLLRHGMSAAGAEQEAKKAYTLYQNIGNAIGLFSMGPLCALLGRRRAFLLMQLGALIAAPVVCFVPTTYTMLLVLLPVMGFFVAGMHAGYAVWFPELFPAQLRATGSGICFNGARLLAAPALTISGFLKSSPHFTLPLAVTVLSLVYLPGLLVALLLPETGPTASSTRS